jgi:hypothetical protein
MMRGTGLLAAGGEGLGSTADAADNTTMSWNERGSESCCTDPPEEPDLGLDTVQWSSLEQPAGRKGLA